MTYDLTNPLHRRQFLARVRKLYSEGHKVELSDKSVRTLRQNAYLHCLVRITAFETGVTEAYAKDEYFKRQANKDAFVTEVEDPITGERTQTLRSSSSLSVEEMSSCIDRFRTWASVHGIYLPDARLTGDGDRMEFASDGDREAFEQAVVETGRAERFLA